MSSYINLSPFLSQFLSALSLIISLSSSLLHTKRTSSRWILISIRSRKFRPLLNFTNWRVCKYARFIALKIITTTINLRTFIREGNFIRKLLVGLMTSEFKFEINFSLTSKLIENVLLVSTNNKYVVCVCVCVCVCTHIYAKHI